MDATDRTIQGLPMNSQNAVTKGLNFVNIDNNGGTSTTTSWDAYGPKNAVDVVVTEETIEITYVQRALYSYTTINNSFTIGGPQQTYHNPDRVFKEIYGVQEGRLTLVKTIEGRIVPPQLTETYEFEE